jgi:hypothetical protein
MPDETQTGQKVIYKQRELVIRLPREDEGVDVGVPETGDQEAPRPGDNACPLGKLSRVSGPDLGDPIPFDDHRGLGTRRRSGGIDDGDVRLAPPRAPSTKCLRVISLVRMASGPIRPENEPLSRSERRDRREKYDPGSGNRRGIPLYEVVDTNRQHRWTVPTPSREQDGLGVSNRERVDHPQPRLAQDSHPALVVGPGAEEHTREGEVVAQPRNQRRQ